jgi:hypothetical protein
MIILSAGGHVRPRIRKTLLHEDASDGVELSANIYKRRSTSTLSIQNRSTVLHSSWLKEPLRFFPLITFCRANSDLAISRVCATGVTSSTDELSVFTPPLTNTGVNTRQWIEYRPTNQISGESPLEFLIPPQSVGYMDLRRGTLKIKLRLTRIPTVRLRGSLPSCSWFFPLITFCRANFDLAISRVCATGVTSSTLGVSGSTMYGVYRNLRSQEQAMGTLRTRLQEMGAALYRRVWGKRSSRSQRPIPHGKRCPLATTHSHSRTRHS